MTVDRRLQVSQFAVCAGSGTTIVACPAGHARKRAWVRIALNIVTLVSDSAIGGTVDLQDMNGIFRCRPLFVVIGASQAGNGRDSAGMVIGGAIGHEATIGMADQVNAIGIHVVFKFHGIDDVEYIAGIVHLAAKEITTGIGGVPESIVIATRLLVAIGCHQQEAVLIGNLAKTHVGILAGAAGCITM